MKSNNPRMERLKEMMSLEERRGQLQAEMDELTARMNDLKDRLFEATAESTPSPAKGESNASTSNTKKSSVKSGASKRAPRGALRDQIMTALEAAGPSGVRVKELAEAIGTKAVNIHSWFHSAIKRNPSIKKITGGHYSFEGGSSNSAKPASKQQSAANQQAAPTSKSSKPANASKPGRASKPAKAGKRGGGTSKRGELSSRILSELQAAGPGGIAVKDLADKVGAKYKNIYIWFATTGKKNSSIKKVGPAQYRLA